MFRKHLAAAIAVAALGSAALASSASALPIDQLAIDTPGHTFQFGTNCVPGQPPGGPGTLNWRNNPANTSGAPLLTGRLCLQGTNATARMAVIYHDSGANLITRFASNASTGNGGPLSEFAVNAGGPRVSYQSLDHVHVETERLDAAGNWVPVPGTNRVLFP